MNIPKITSVRFSSITRLLKKDLFQNPQTLDAFYSTTKESALAIGSLPKDLIKLFKSSDKKQTKLAYQEFTKILSEIGNDLQLFEGKKLETAQTLNVKNFIGTYLPKLAKVDIQPDRISRIIAEMRKKLTPNKDVIQEFNEIISLKMSTLMKEKNLINPSDNVKLTYLGQGVFKNAFKFEVLNKEGKHLMHPKVLLSFKNDSYIQQENKAILELLKKYMTSSNKAEFVSKLNGMLNSANPKVVPPEQRQLYKETLIKMYEDINSGKGLNKFTELIEQNEKYQTKYNGILPESNIIMFFKHAIGKPLAKTDFIDISYINPLNNIGIAEYSDDLLPKISKKINLRKIGLFHDDLIMNKDNMVADRVVDYGNMKIEKNLISQTLAESSIARRYYNKIEQIKFKDSSKTQEARIQYWNDLYNKAINHRIPNHKEIMKALEVSKEHILVENHKLLRDFIPQA